LGFQQHKDQLQGFKRPSIQWIPYLPAVKGKSTRTRCHPDVAQGIETGIPPLILGSIT